MKHASRAALQLLLGARHQQQNTGGQALGTAWRWHTVLAWGRNLEGQCGTDGSNLVLRPTPVLELHGQVLRCLSASRFTSAVVAAEGHVFTWGDGGGGKLGHSHIDALRAPCRVEALVQRADVRLVAAGDSHTLLCDSQGHVWACGENSEGQCGLGTPLDVIAMHRNVAYHLSVGQALTSYGAANPSGPRPPAPAPGTELPAAATSASLPTAVRRAAGGKRAGVCQPTAQSAGDATTAARRASEDSAGGGPLDGPPEGGAAGNGEPLAGGGAQHAQHDKGAASVPLTAPVQQRVGRHGGKGRAAHADVVAAAAGTALAAKEGDEGAEEAGRDDAGTVLARRLIALLGKQQQGVAGSSLTDGEWGGGSGGGGGGGAAEARARWHRPRGSTHLGRKAAGEPAAPVWSHNQMVWASLQHQAAAQVAGVRPEDVASSSRDAVTAARRQEAMAVEARLAVAAGAGGDGSGGRISAAPEGSSDSGPWSGLRWGPGGGAPLHDPWHLRQSLVGVGEPSLALVWGGADLPGFLLARGAQPGQQAVPTRLGRDLHPLAGPWPGRQRAHRSPALAQGLGRMQRAGEHEEHEEEEEQEARDEAERCLSTWDAQNSHGLEHVQVRQVAVGRHYSVAVDNHGQVWTWGACFNGCLGNRNTWISSPQRVDGELAAVLEAEGGARSVAAGGTFCVALTASGKAVFWGTPPTPTNTATGSSSTANPTMATVQRQSVHLERRRSDRRVEAGLVAGIPPLTHVAAGHQHALLSDGQRVWLVGRSVGPRGNEVAAAPWAAPLEVLDLGRDAADAVPSPRASRMEERVKELRVGVQSSAVVTTGGALWMWGKVLDAGHANALLKRQKERTPWMDREVPDEGIWSWPGFGAASPALVTGLSGRVVDVALGGWHALALVE